MILDLSIESPIETEKAIGYRITPKDILWCPKSLLLKPYRDGDVELHVPDWIYDKKVEEILKKNTKTKRK